jgi:uncharacterized protein (TIGR00106 family)
MPIVLIELSIFPIDKGDSLSASVAEALDIIDASGLPYRLGPMGTTIEGEYEACMKVVEACFARMRQSSHRVSIQLKVDYREGRRGALASKIEAVEEQLGRKLCT